MVAGMLHHLHSLRGLQRDHGWIHTLLEEAENKRMCGIRQTHSVLTCVALLQNTMHVGITAGAERPLPRIYAQLCLSDMDLPGVTTS